MHAISRSVIPLAALSLLLTGCVSTTTPRAVSSASPTTSATHPTPTPTPTVAPALVLTLDGASFTDGSGTTTARYDDVSATVSFWTSHSGVAPTVTKDAKYPITTYDFGAVSISVMSGVASVTVRQPSVNGVPVSTDTGVSVGSTRAQAMAAGAFTVWAGSQGLPEQLGVGARDVPGTRSLVRQGQVGRQFETLTMSGDTVTRIQIAGNDYSDL